jgi:hypothetical protein
MTRAAGKFSQVLIYWVFIMGMFSGNTLKSSCWEIAIATSRALFSLRFFFVATLFDLFWWWVLGVSPQLSSLYENFDRLEMDAVINCVPMQFVKITILDFVHFGLWRIWLWKLDSYFFEFNKHALREDLSLDTASGVYWRKRPIGLRLSFLGLSSLCLSWLEF